jgi:hypothetical protein
MSAKSVPLLYDAARDEISIYIGGGIPGVVVQAGAGPQQVGIEYDVDGSIIRIRIAKASVQLAKVLRPGA